MGGGYVIPIHTGSLLLIKASKTSSEEFNRKIFALLNTVKEMEYKYKMTDPGKMSQDYSYCTLGPLALIATIQQAYSCLLSFQDWPALVSALPQSNNVSSSSSPHVTYTAPLPFSRKCYRCGGDHHMRDCPKSSDKHGFRERKDKVLTPRKDRSGVRDRVDLPGWRYVEPKDLNTTIVEDGKTWKYCTKCTCKRTGKVGLYNTSHFNWEHTNLPHLPSKTREVNFTTIRPSGPSSAAVHSSGPSSATVKKSLPDDDDIEFQGIGAWCVEVVDPASHTVD
jgi:hypothetical protein